jgi:hypothetical protein
MKVDINLYKAPAKVEVDEKSVIPFFSILS